MSSVREFREMSGRPVLAPFTRRRSGLAARAAQVAGIVLLIGFCFVWGFFYALTTPYLAAAATVPLVCTWALVVWALPDSAKQPPTRTVVLLFYAFLVVLMLWPNYLAIDLPGLPWITFQRLVGLPMVLALTICVSTSAGFRAEVARICSAEPTMIKLLLAFVFFQLLTLPLSAELGASVQRVIVAQTNWTAMFFAAMYVFRREDRVRAWSYLLWGCAMVVAGIGIVEFLEKKVLWAGHVPGFLAVDDPVAQKALAGAVRSATGVYRARSTAVHPLVFAEMMALCLPFVLHHMVTARKVLVRAAAALSIPVLFLGTYFTDARLGLLGFMLGALLYGLFWALKFWRTNKGNPLGPAIVLTIPAVFVAAFAASLLVRRIRVEVWGGGAEAASNAARMTQIELGLAKVAQNPIGFGMAQGADALGARNAAGVASVDNYYLTLALDFGVLGLLAFVALMGLAVYRAAAITIATAGRKDRSDIAFAMPVVVSLIVFLVIKSVLSQADNHALVFVMLGMIVAFSYRLKRERAGEPSTPEAIVAPPSRRRRGIRGLGAP